MGCSTVENININNIPKIHTDIQPIYIDKSFQHEDKNILGIDNLKKIKNGEKIPFYKN